MAKYAIQGWIGTGLLFGGVTFDSYEEAWDFIYANDPEPEQSAPECSDGRYYDYYVVELSPVDRWYDDYYVIELSPVDRWYDDYDVEETTEDDD